MRKFTFMLAAIAMTFLCAGAVQADVPPGEPGTALPLFEDMDQDGDGVVTQQEFVEYEFDEQQRIELFSVMDQNGDGEISRQEWEAYREQMGLDSMEDSQVREAPRYDAWDQQVPPSGRPTQATPRTGPGSGSGSGE